MLGFGCASCAIPDRSAIDMSLQNATAFLARCAPDASLRSRLAEAVTGKTEHDAARVVAELGHAAGHEFTADEALVARREQRTSLGLLDADSLDVVAGGAAPHGPAGPPARQAYDWITSW
jgi:hypothetical protein